MKINIGSTILLILLSIGLNAQINEELSNKFFEKADSLVDLKEYKAAVNSLDSAIYYNSENFDAYSLKGFCQLNLGMHMRAIESFDLALILEPNYAEVYYLRGISKLELNQEKKACEDFIEAYALGIKDAMKFIEQHCDLEDIKNEE